MNNNKFNEEKNNGVVRKRVIEKIGDHKKSIAGVITGVMLVMMLTFLTSSNTFGPASDAADDRSQLNIVNVSYSSSVTAITTSTIKMSSTTSSSLTSTTSNKSTSNSTTSTDGKTTVASQSETTGVTEVEETIVEEVEAAVDNAVESNNDTTEPTSEYIVYKPSTHYVHKNTCRWFNSDCQEITSTEGIECRKCSECNPDIEIITPYNPPQPQPAASGSALDCITETEYIYLCNTVAREYGSDWVSVYDKACVVAVVMNRVRDGGWSNGNPSTIYNVITAPCQFNPSYCTDYYQSCVTQSCKDAVDYYFAHQSEFPHYTSFWGDGRSNHFS